MDKKQRFSDIMLVEKRQYIIDKVKAPLFKAIKVLCNRYPEVTKDNCNNPNTKVLIDLEEEFFRHFINPSRIPLFRAFFRCFKAEIDHDIAYSAPFDWCLLYLYNAIKERRYKLNLPSKYYPYWKEEQGNEERIDG